MAFEYTRLKGKVLKKLLKSKILWGAFLAVTAFSGCGNSEQFVFTNTGIVNVAPGAPVAANDSFAALGNATLNQAAATGVLTNDTLNGGSITSFDSTGSQGGTLDLNQDGSFTYTPALNFVGAETFTYTLGNAGGSSTATITLTSTGLGRFVDNSAADNGAGTQADPFDNLASAVAAAQSGDTIFVARGDGSNNGMTGGFTLPAGVDLVGEGTGLVLAQTIVPPGLAPTLEGPITCGGDNVIQGITVDGSVSDLVIISGVGNVTIQDSTLSNPTNNHVSIIDGSGTLQILQSTLDTPADSDQDYIDVDNASTNATINVSGNTFLNTATVEVDALLSIEPTGTSQINASFNNNVADGTVPEQFDYGFYFDNLGTGACTCSVDGNTFDNFANGDSFYPIGAFATAGPMSGSISNNTVSNSGFGAIFASVGDSDTITISGNQIDTGLYGIFSYYDGDGTFIIENNNIQNSGNTAIYSQIFDPTHKGKVAVRNNTTASNTESYYAVTQNADNTLCVDMTGNSFDSLIRFDGNDAGIISVERLEAGEGGPLSAVNTFGVGAMVDLVDPTVVSVDPETCLIP